MTLEKLKDAAKMTCRCGHTGWPHQQLDGNATYCNLCTCPFWRPTLRERFRCWWNYRTILHFKRCHIEGMGYHISDRMQRELKLQAKAEAYGEVPASQAPQRTS